MADSVRTSQLTKHFRVPVAGPTNGVMAKLRHFVRNPSEPRVAVENLSFTVPEGEILGFLGANGSGKSTTIKMLTGILTPTSGEVGVLGYVPHRQRREYTQHIGVVFGQKSLLWWNIPVVESFKLYRDIYGQSERAFNRRLEHFSRVLEIDEFLHVPVRKLSLGMRMRAELAASLLHQPKIVFLDEPTIGLDVIARRNLKSFLRRINQDEGVTIFLTTHNMFDVEDLCQRCIIMEHGHKLYDGDIATLKSAERDKTLEFELVEILDHRRFEAVLRRCEVLARTADSLRVRAPSEETVEIIAQLFTTCRLGNLNVLPPSLECIVERIFSQQRDEREEVLHGPLRQALG